MSKLDTSAPIAGPFPFEPFPKIARLRRECVITEKIDGTNASITIIDNGNGELKVFAASRNRWIDLEHDNAGFAAWCVEHDEELKQLGVGTHYGEWWGQGIQRRYGQDRKRFSLFNTARWGDPPPKPAVRVPSLYRAQPPLRPACCDVVPVISTGTMGVGEKIIDVALNLLRENGSYAAPGFMDPEGIVVYHTAARTLFKVTLKNDDKPKGSTE
jgi:hypothetical protein